MVRSLGRWRKPGGIVWLRELIAEHAAAFAYDFRSRFHVSIDTVGREISYGEAYLLVAQLLKDPSSAVYASANDWKYPLSREGLILSDLFDLLMRANSGKRRTKPYPRPFTSGAKRIGKTKRSTAEVKKLLAKMNPKE